MRPGARARGGLGLGPTVAAPTMLAGGVNQ